MMLRWAYFCALFLFVAADKSSFPTKRGKSNLLNFSGGERAYDQKGSQISGQDAEQGLQGHLESAKRMYDPTFGAAGSLQNEYYPTQESGVPSSASFGSFGNPPFKIGVVIPPHWRHSGDDVVDYTDVQAAGNRLPLLSGLSPVNPLFNPLIPQTLSPQQFATSQWSPQVTGAQPYLSIPDNGIYNRINVPLKYNYVNPLSLIPSTQNYLPVSQGNSDALWASKSSLAPYASKVVSDAPVQFLQQPNAISAARAFITPGTYYPTFQGNPFAPPSFFGPSSSSFVNPMQPVQQITYPSNLQQQIPTNIPNLQQLISNLPQMAPYIQQLSSTQLPSLSQEPLNIQSPQIYPMPLLQSQHSISPKKDHR